MLKFTKPTKTEKNNKKFHFVFGHKNEFVQLQWFKLCTENFWLNHQRMFDKNNSSSFFFSIVPKSSKLFCLILKPSYIFLSVLNCSTHFFFVDVSPTFFLWSEPFFNLFRLFVSRELSKNRSPLNRNAHFLHLFLVFLQYVLFIKL